ncbi:hypothetical protein VTN31DRAFT_7337 [Thermomyces dupontii]|uniref:uncharacterized protein n=1 Tax=Talaromyces thermophilus TaxID=28565 RepID=UPI003742B99E
MAAPLDPKVSQVLQSHTTHHTDGTPRAANDLDTDAILEALENEDDSAYRAQRIQQLHDELRNTKAALSNSSNPTNPEFSSVEPLTYPTLRTDQAVLDLTTTAERVVVHFAHPDFARCATMDTHLRKLAGRHYDVRFARVDVRDIPFVVEKLKIRVLPCVVGFVDGVAKDRIVGFEGLGMFAAAAGVATSRVKPGEEFRTTDLERRLLDMGVLVKKRLVDDDGQLGARSDSEEDEDEDREYKKSIRRGIRSGATRAANDSDDDDWD